jgi:hypothetical protein
MSLAGRIVSFGSAGLLVIAGSVCAAVLGGGTGQILALVLIGLGLVLATALVFLEVGLSEDRERAAVERARAREQRLQAAQHPPSPRRLKQARLERSRGHRRRLS